MESDQKIRVLVIEDNPTQANMLRISLNSRGFEVENVAYLGHALERLAKGGVDVILLDLFLPDSDGISTFYEIYNHASDLPIVVLSSVNDHLIAQAALEGGAQDYLVKGVPSDESISRCLRYAIERHRFERKIWESERTTRLIVENAHDAFISMDGEGKITGWNLKAETIFGWYRKEALGRPIAELIFAENVRDYFEREIKAFLLGQRGNLINQRVETVLIRKDGTRFAAEIAMFSVTMGSIYSLCGFVQDISERKVVEQRLQQMNSELESLVNQRTLELGASSKRLQQFAKQTSRELQEPLVALQGFALKLANELNTIENPVVEDQIGLIMSCSAKLVANLQALAAQGQSPDELTGAYETSIARSTSEKEATTGVQATQVSANAKNKASVTKVLPVLEKPPGKTFVNKTLTKMERQAAKMPPNAKAERETEH